MRSKADCENRVHTFGVGSGADERLVKNVAMAGIGHFQFINKPEEIEEKVIESLTKTVLEYSVVIESGLYDKAGKLVHEFPKNEPLLPNSC